MADEPEAVQPEQAAGEEEEVITPGYKPPAVKSVDEIKELDADDESLIKYKQTLLGATEGVKDEGGSNVLVKAFVVSPVGRDKIVMDLTGDLSKLKSKHVVIKEGTSYKIEIRFRVQREIVSGLKYFQATYRKGIRVDKGTLMVGSYGPKTEAHEYMTPLDEAPSGMISRGHYKIESKFTDDDRNVILKWEWGLDIKKDWE